MFLFFGSRSSIIKNIRLKQQIKCASCENETRFNVATKGYYFHFMFIPLFPLFKQNLLECNHCKKVYFFREVSESVKRVVKREQELDAPKRPLWHGCGCLVIIAVIVLFFMLGIGGYLYNKEELDTSLTDPNRTILMRDIEATTNTPDIKKDSIAFYLKECMFDTSGVGIDMNEIKYLTKQKENRLLVLLKVEAIKKIKRKYRENLVYDVEDCLRLHLPESVDSVFIGVHGKWTMMLTKSPYGKNLDGFIGNDDYILPFYKE